MPDLAYHVRRTPQEIFDAIYDYTFKTDSADHIKLQSNCKFPPTLQVDRTSRAQHADHYFNAAVVTHSLTLLRKWILSLSIEHFKIIRTFVYVVVLLPYGSGSYSTYVASKSKAWKRVWEFEAEMNYKRLPKGVELPEIQVMFEVDDAKPAWVGKKHLS